MADLQLRPYQETAVQSVISAILDRGCLRPEVVLPTGTGKTVIFVHLAKWWHEVGMPGRAVILVDRDELAHQTMDKLASVWPRENIGIVMGSDNDVTADIIVASVQTLRRAGRRAQVRSIGLMIVDECDLAEAPGYREIFDDLDEDVPVVGFTATPVKSDVFSEIVFQRDILDMIPDWLVDVEGERVALDDLSLDDVVQRGGDFAPKSLADALRSADAMRIAANTYLDKHPERPGLVFTPDVQSAWEFAEAFNLVGLPSAAVWGGMQAKERHSVLRRYESGDLQVLVNCAVLTRGFDAPRSQVVLIARPTRKRELYVQIVGRGLRPYPGKKRAYVLDMSGASERYSLAGLADASSRRIVEILPGESLAEAAKRERDAGNPELENYVVSWRAVDMFRLSALSWSQTFEGIWFLDRRCNGCDRFGVNCPGHLIFIWPAENGQYKCGIRRSRNPGQGKWLAGEPEGVSLELAMAVGEAEAGDAPRERYTRDKPTEAQMRFAINLGIPWLGRTKSELSSDLRIAIASACLDRKIRYARLGRDGETV